MNFLYEKVENFIYDMDLKPVKKKIHFEEIKRKKNLSLIMSIKYSHTHTSTRPQPLERNIIWVNKREIKLLSTLWQLSNTHSVAIHNS